MSTKKKLYAPPLTEQQLARIGELTKRAIDGFHGQSDELETALGMLTLGYYVGWKVLVLWHSKKTIRKYEELLSIKVREEYPEVGPLAGRSNAFLIAEKVSNFWKAVSGEDKSISREERKLLSN
jgi:hypothetical protein